MSKPIAVQTFLTAKAAIDVNSTTHGEIEFLPTTEQLQSLSDEQRAELSLHVASGGWAASLQVKRLGWEGVVEALDAEIEKRAKEAAKREAFIEEEKESYRKLLALPALYEPGLPLRKVPFEGWDAAPNYSRGDDEAEKLWSRVQARYRRERLALVAQADAALSDDPSAHIVVGKGPDDATRLVLQAAQVYKDGKYVQDPIPKRANAVIEEIKFREEERAEAWRRACARYVIENVPEYARAAKDGHDVSHVAKRAILAEYEEEECSKVGELISCYGTSDRGCPKAFAYEVLDKLKFGAVGGGRFDGILNAIESSIVRVDVAPEGDAVYRTAVEVTLHWANGTTSELYVLADEEPVPDFVEDEEDEDY